MFAGLQRRQTVRLKSGKKINPKRIKAIKIAIPAAKGTTIHCQQVLDKLAESEDLIQVDGSDNLFYVWYEIEWGSLLHHGRNNLVEPSRHPLGGERWYDYLLFCDADMLFRPEWPAMLAAHDLDIVGGLCVRTNYPYRPTLGVMHPTRGVYTTPVLGPKLIEDMNARKQETRLIEVDAIGTGFTMMRREVFENLDPPWYFYDLAPGADLSSGKWQHLFMGEDYYFCQKAKKAGMRVFCDTWVTPAHVGPYEFTILDNVQAMTEIAEEIHRKTGKTMEDISTDDLGEYHRLLREAEENDQGGVHTKSKTSNVVPAERPGHQRGR